MTTHAADTISPNASVEPPRRVPDQRRAAALNPGSNRCSTTRAASSSCRAASTSRPSTASATLSASCVEPASAEWCRKPAWRSRSSRSQTSTPTDQLRALRTTDGRRDMADQSADNRPIRPVVELLRWGDRTVRSAVEPVRRW